MDPRKKRITKVGKHLQAKKKKNWTELFWLKLH